MANKVPPQNLEAEESLLAAIMMKDEVFAEVANIITAEDFYRQAHSVIYSAMEELFNNREPID
ncbi:MAG: replicative DNA helicase, partial [Selenomonadaceae bacterium]|nr:replicative DNA helicase [Selenomonadaceae bacterium]